MSLYESMTSSCGVTGQPLTTTTLDFYTYVQFNRTTIAH